VQRAREVGLILPLGRCAGFREAQPRAAEEIADPLGAYERHLDWFLQLIADYDGRVPQHVLISAHSLRSTVPAGR